MVPLTSKAFMPGTLVHTNEILVLLGDNWFVETSAKNAAAIAQRRVKACDDILDTLQQEVERVEGWKKQAGDLSREKEECVEITEDFDPEAERRWREKHRQNIKRDKLQQAGAGDDKSDEDESNITSEESDITNESDSKNADDTGLSVTNL